MSEILPPLVYQFGAGGVLGFIIGYAVKKMAKVLLVIAGLVTLTLLLLEYNGVINIDLEKLLRVVRQFTGALGQSSEWIAPILARLPFAASFVIGLALGLKVG